MWIVAGLDMAYTSRIAENFYLWFESQLIQTPNLKLNGPEMI